MERFALAAAVVLGFALTAALCSLFVPLRRVLERREQNQQPAQSEQPRPAPLRAPLWGGLCAAAGTVAAVGVGWLAACVGQPELLGSEGRLMTRLLTALAGSLAFGAVGFAEDSSVFLGIFTSCADPRRLPKNCRTTCPQGKSQGKSTIDAVFVDNFVEIHAAVRPLDQ